jgi:hypothetical protein
MPAEEEEEEESSSYSSSDDCDEEEEEEDLSSKKKQADTEAMDAIANIFLKLNSRSCRGYNQKNLAKLQKCTMATGRNVFPKEAASKSVECKACGDTFYWCRCCGGAEKQSALVESNVDRGVGGDIEDWTRLPSHPLPRLQCGRSEKIHRDETARAPREFFLDIH